jgi:hypothetical protein
VSLSKILQETYGSAVQEQLKRSAEFLAWADPATPEEKADRYRRWAEENLERLDREVVSVCTAAGFDFIGERTRDVVAQAIIHTAIRCEEALC